MRLKTIASLAAVIGLTACNINVGSLNASGNNVSATVGTASPTPSPEATTNSGTTGGGGGTGGGGSGTGGGVVAGEPSVTQVNGNTYVHTESVTTNETWDAAHVHEISGDIDVDSNAVLTIQPGAVIKFDQGAELDVGYNSAGTLIANGTATASIQFVANASQAGSGFWNSLRFYSGTGHVLNYCTVSYGGSDSGEVEVRGTSAVKITNSSISNSAHAGLQVSSGASLAAFANNTITANAYYPIDLYPQQVASLDASSSLTGNVNGLDEVLVESGNLTASTTWPNVGVPLKMLGTDDIENNSTLTLTPGSTLSFPADGELDVGYANGSGTLIASGSAAQPITFTADGASPANGAWNSLRFYNGGGNVLNNCRVLYAGVSGDGAVRLFNNASLTLANSTIAHSAGTGLQMDSSTATLIGFAANTMTANTNAPISIFPNQAGNLDTASHFIGNLNSNDVVELQQGDISTTQTWPNPGVPYFLTGDDNVTNNSTLTLAAGVTVGFDSGAELDVGYGSNGTGRLVTSGTSQAPVLLQSINSTATWKGLRFYGSSTGALTQTTIQNASSGYYDLSVLDSAQVTAPSLTLANAQSGLDLASSATINSLGVAGITAANSGITFTGISGTPVTTN